MPATFSIASLPFQDTPPNGGSGACVFSPPPHPPHPPAPPRRPPAARPHRRPRPARTARHLPASPRAAAAPPAPPPPAPPPAPARPAPPATHLALRAAPYPRLRAALRRPPRIRIASRAPHTAAPFPPASSPRTRSYRARRLSTPKHRDVRREHPRINAARAVTMSITRHHEHRPPFPRPNVRSDVLIVMTPPCYTRCDGFSGCGDVRCRDWPGAGSAAARKARSGSGGSASRLGA